MVEWLMPIMFIGGIILIWLGLKSSCDECGFQLFACGFFASILGGIGCILLALGIN